MTQVGGLDGHVDLPGDGRVVEISGADHGQDLSRRWLDSHQRAIQHVQVA